MAANNDLYGEMRRFLLDDQTADRMLSGHLAPEDAPPGFSRTAHLLQAVKSPASAAELARKESTLSAMAAASRAGAPSLPHKGTKAPLTRRSNMLTKLLTAKVAAIAVATVIGATAAAAATGSLPTAAQNAMSSALSHVGISVPRGSQSQAPNGTSQTGSKPSTHGKPTTTKSPGNSKAKGPLVTGAAKYGLCTAYAARSNNPSSSKGTNSVAFTKLESAAKAAGESVSKFCAGATPPSSTSNPGKSHVPSNPGPPSSTSNPGQSHVPSNPGPPSSTSNPGKSHVPSNPGPPSSTSNPGQSHVPSNPGPPSSTSNPSKSHVPSNR